MSFERELRLKIQENLHLARGQELCIPCPICTRMKFYVNLRTGMYVCHRATCGMSGRLRLNGLQRSGPLSASEQSATSKPGGSSRSTSESLMRLPSDTQPLETGTSWTTQEIFSGKYKGRIAFEVRDYNKQLQGYVLRSYTENPKALTFVNPGYCRLHFPRLSSPCSSLVLVEDILSAERLAEYLPTAALLGTTLTEAMIDYLLDKRVRSVVLCLDDDATHKGIKQARKHRLVLDSVAVPCSPDPKDMNAKQLDDLVQKIHEVRQEARDG